MSGIKNLSVNMNTYIGQIDLRFTEPGVHAILCADSEFLDRAVESMRNAGEDCFETEGGKHKKALFLMKTDQLVDGMTVAENLWLCTGKGFFLTPRTNEEKSTQLFEEVGYHLPAGADVASLTISQRCFAELYRALILQPGILVANEATANLSYREISFFNQIVERLVSKGTMVFVLTTKLEEALKIADYFHVYVNGSCIADYTKEEAIRDPQEIYLQMLDMISDRSGEKGENQQWMKIINDSIRIENQMTRVNAVLRAYSDRISELLEGSYCRLYLYRYTDKTLTFFGGSEEGAEIYSALNGGAIGHFIDESEALMILTDRDEGYQEIFAPGLRPQSLICYTLKNNEDEWIMIEVGVERYVRNARTFRTDMLRYIAIEVLIFVENNKLRSQISFLQESNHRIKNNMQMILGYLMLQQASLHNQVTGAENSAAVDMAFKDLQDRIMAIYEVHNLISTGENASEYADLNKLFEKLNYIYATDLKAVLRCGAIVLSKKTLLALSTIFNELLNNTVKHNRNSIAPVRVEISIDEKDDDLYIFYHDYGVGHEEQTGKARSGIGMRLIRTTVENELRGRYEIDTRNGYSFAMTFPKEEHL